MAPRILSLEKGVGEKEKEREGKTGEGKYATRGNLELEKIE